MNTGIIINLLIHHSDLEVNKEYASFEYSFNDFYLNATYYEEEDSLWIDHLKNNVPSEISDKLKKCIKNKLSGMIYDYLENMDKEIKESCLDAISEKKHRAFINTNFHSIY